MTPWHRTGTPSGHDSRSERVSVCLPAHDTWPTVDPTTVAPTGETRDSIFEGLSSATLFAASHMPSIIPGRRPNSVAQQTHRVPAQTHKQINKHT